MSSTVNKIAVLIICICVSSAIIYREVVYRPQQIAEQQRLLDEAAQRQAALEQARQAAVDAANAALAAKRAAEPPAPPPPYDDGNDWISCDLEPMLKSGFTQQGLRWKNDNIIIFPGQGPLQGYGVAAKIYDRSKKYARFDGNWDLKQDYIERWIDIASHDAYGFQRPSDYVYQMIDRRTLVMTIEHENVIEWEGPCSKLPPGQRPEVVDPQL